MRVLVIEHKPNNQVFIKEILDGQHYETTIADSFDSAQTLALDSSFNAIILDVDPSTDDYLTQCKSLREKNVRTPILILSEENRVEIKVKYLNAGADDYLTTPYDTDEFLARLNAISRRVRLMPKPGIITGGEIMVDKVKRTCTINGANVKLTNNELDLLAFLMEQNGEVASQYKLQKDIWGIDYYTPSNFVNVYISYLRKKISKHTTHKYIKTLRSKGFLFEPPPSSE